MGKMLVGAGIFIAGLVVGYTVGIQPSESTPQNNSSAPARKIPAAEKKK